MGVSNQVCYISMSTCYSKKGLIKNKAFSAVQDLRLCLTGLMVFAMLTMRNTYSQLHYTIKIRENLRGGKKPNMSFLGNFSRSPHFKWTKVANKTWCLNISEYFNFKSSFISLSVISVLQLLPAWESLLSWLLFFQQKYLQTSEFQQKSFTLCFPCNQMTQTFSGNSAEALLDLEDVVVYCMSKHIWEQVTCWQ